MIRPEIYVVLVTTTIAALKIFGQIVVLTRGGPGNATLMPSYLAYQTFFEKARVGYGPAISTVLTLIRPDTLSSSDSSYSCCWSSRRCISNSG